MGARVLILLTALAAIGSFSAAPAAAATCQWQGANFVDWRASTANWDCGVIPGAGDTVVLDGGAEHVTVSQNEAAQSLAVTNFASVVLAGEPTLAVGAGGLTTTTGGIGGPGTMTVAGPFTHASGSLTVSSGADVIASGAATFSGGDVRFGGGTGGEPTLRFNGALDLTAT